MGFKKTALRPWKPVLQVVVEQFPFDDFHLKREIVITKEPLFDLLPLFLRQDAQKIIANLPPVALIIPGLPLSVLMVPNLPFRVHLCAKACAFLFMHSNTHFSRCLRMRCARIRKALTAIPSRWARAVRWSILALFSCW